MLQRHQQINELCRAEMYPTSANLSRPTVPSEIKTLWHGLSQPAKVTRPLRSFSSAQRKTIANLTSLSSLAFTSNLLIYINKLSIEWYVEILLGTVGFALKTLPIRTFNFVFFIPKYQEIACEVE